MKLEVLPLNVTTWEVGIEVDYPFNVTAWVCNEVGIDSLKLIMVLM